VGAGGGGGGGGGRYRREGEDAYSSPSITNVNNAWSYTFTSPYDFVLFTGTPWRSVFALYKGIRC
jgi:hypothetical protein